MAKFSARMQRTASTTLPVGTLSAAAASPRRAKVYDLLIGSEATPADNAFLWQVQRHTADGTGSAVTPQSLDPADSLASTIVAKENTTVDATRTTNAFLLNLGLNQRASFRWVAAPGGELVIPATANNGLSIMTITSSAVAVTTTVHYDEQ